MTPEQVKARLEGIRWLDKEIQSLQLELQYLDQGLFKKSTLTQTKVQTSRVNNTENELVYVLKGQYCGCSMSITWKYGISKTR